MCRPLSSSLLWWSNRKSNMCSWVPSKRIFCTESFILRRWYFSKSNLCTILSIWMGRQYNENVCDDSIRLQLRDLCSRNQPQMCHSNLMHRIRWSSIKKVCSCLLCKWHIKSQIFWRSWHSHVCSYLSKLTWLFWRQFYKQMSTYLSTS